MSGVRKTPPEYPPESIILLPGISGFFCALYVALRLYFTGVVPLFPATYAVIGLGGFAVGCVIVWRERIAKRDGRSGERSG